MAMTGFTSKMLFINGCVDNSLEVYVNEDYNKLEVSSDLFDEVLKENRHLKSVLNDSKTPPFTRVPPYFYTRDGVKTYLIKVKLNGHTEYLEGTYLPSRNQFITNTTKFNEEDVSEVWNLPE